jgi:hypothetical protein
MNSKDMIRYLNSYQTGNHTAEQLRVAVLKRIRPVDLTARIIAELTKETAKNLIELYGSVQGVRYRLDELLAFLRFFELPLHKELFESISIINWAAIEQRVHELIGDQDGI